MATAAMRKEVGFELPSNLMHITIEGLLWHILTLYFVHAGISYYAASNAVRVEEYEELINRGWRR